MLEEVRSENHVDLFAAEKCQVVPRCSVDLDSRRRRAAGLWIEVDSDAAPGSRVVDELAKAGTKVEESAFAIHPTREDPFPEDFPDHTLPSAVAFVEPSCIQRLKFAAHGRGVPGAGGARARAVQITHPFPLMFHT